MIYKMFTVYDSKVGAFLMPFFMRSTPEAIRGWIDVVNDPSTKFNKYPEDYTLFEIGEYDEVNGTVTMLPAKVSHGVAIEYVKQTQTVSTIGGSNG